MDEDTNDLSIDQLVDKLFDEQDEAPKEEISEEEEVVVEESEDEGSETTEEGEASEEEVKEPTSSEDEAEVVVQVDGKDLSVKVRDLKRLYGQEASLTQKSQAVAAAARSLESQGLYVAKILESRLAQAQAKVDKYKDVDLFKANRELEPEEFDAIRSAKADAEAEFKLLTEEAKDFVRLSEDSRKTFIREQAKASLVEIKRAIPEWNDKLYEDIRAYAIGQGFDRDAANEVIDPAAIKMMHKAMQFDAAKAKSKNVTEKLVKAPKGVTRKSENTNDYKASKNAQLLKKAQATGDIDDIVEALAASRTN